MTSCSGSAAVGPTREAAAILLVISVVVAPAELLAVKRDTQGVVRYGSIGEEVSFNCTSSSRARHLSWYDGVLKLTSSLHGVSVQEITNDTVKLTIHNITTYHYGVYQCTDDDSGTVLTNFDLLSPLGDMYGLITNHHVTRRGETRVLCASNKFIKLNNEFHHSIINVTSLVINSLTDQGKYLCLNKNNIPVSIDYIIVAGYLPLNITYNYDGNQWQQVHPYKSVDCMASGGPGPVTVKWRRHGNAVPYDGRMHVKDVSMGNYTTLRLVLESAFPEIDSSRFTCVAENEWQAPVQRSLYINFKINSDTGIYIAYWPENVIAIEGSNISVDCYTVSPNTAVNPGSIVFQLVNKTAAASLNTTRDQSHEDLTQYVSKSTMLIYNIQPSDASLYRCLVVGLVGGADKTTNLTVISDPLHIDSFEHPNTTYIICSVTVHPLLDDRYSDVSITVWWYSDTSRPKMIYPQQTNVNDTIKLATNVDDTGTYECRASIDNFVMSRNVSVTIPSGVTDESGGLDYLALLAAVAVVVFLILVMFIAIMFCLVYRHSNSTSSGQYSNMVSRTKIGARLSTNSCASADFVINKSSSGSSILSSPDWIIPYEKLVIDGQIGAGAFGHVSKAYLDNEAVAVKTLQCDSSDENMFEKEVMILHHVGHHEHIIGLLGVSMHASKYLLVMELATKGNLLDYLRQKRTDRYYPLSVHEVLNFAKQIALGMEHLASQNCVHCDLAARNVLICDDFVLKISDFGLARKLYSGIYEKNRNKKNHLPIRWMAPESMLELKFSSQSDMWSYGVVLWEIFQLGVVPYYHIPVVKLCSLLQQGHRLAKPDNCDDDHYQLMLSCWHGNPDQRPTFTQLVQDIAQLMSCGNHSNSNQVYINWSDNQLDYYSDSEDSDSCSVAFSSEEVCPVHGSTLTRDHPAIRRNLPMGRKDSGLPDSPNDPFAISKKNFATTATATTMTTKQQYHIEETDV